MIAAQVVVRLIMLVNSNLETSTRAVTAPPMSRDPTTTEDKMITSCVLFLAVQDSSITDIVCPLVGLSQLKIRA